MSVGMRLLAIAVAIAAAIAGVNFWQSHLVNKGDAQGAARVQGTWDAQESARNAATARDNATKFRNAERTAHEDAQRETARKTHAAAAATAVRSLHADIARLNNRPHHFPATDAGLAACAGEAATARELFSDSSGAYQELAAEADSLRDQVTGLQDFAHAVCRAGQAGQQGGTVDR